VIPIVSIVGKSNTGKTTFLEKLVPELVQRGYRVAVVKHDVHGFDLDQPGKDSWRLAQAGSTVVAISSPDKLAIIRKNRSEATLDEIALMLDGSADILLTEGYKSGSKPKVEIVRAAKSTVPLCTEAELVALVTDVQLPLQVPTFGLDDAAGVAGVLEKQFLSGREDEEAELIVNGQSIPLKPFIREIFDRTNRAIISTLHGISPDAPEITIRLRRQPRP
jgi:molybdopterin-guanine dinucleotide biosynthesis adapter protein